MRVFFFFLYTPHESPPDDLFSAGGFEDKLPLRSFQLRLIFNYWVTLI